MSCLYKQKHLSRAAGNIRITLIARFLWGQHGAQLGPTGPRWAPCWPHEPCSLGVSLSKLLFTCYFACIQPFVNCIKIFCNNPQMTWINLVSIFFIIIICRQQRLPLVCISVWEVRLLYASPKLWRHLPCFSLNIQLKKWQLGNQGPASIWRCRLTSIGNPIVEIRRS